ncbi:MAG: nucleoside deaminase [Dongiaceae bacterium]
MDDTALMRRALLQAERAKQAGELPYGAVLASRDGRILAETHDEVASQRDPTAHAELLAVQRAAAAEGSDLSGCRLVSTAEGCAMCMMAAWLAGVAVVQYGASMAEIKALRADALDEIGVPAAELAARFERRMEVRAGLLRDDCLALWRSPDRAPSA